MVNYINYLVDPCKRIRFPDSEKNFARGIGNRGIFACGILNTGQGIRNPTDDWFVIQVPLIKCGIHYLKSEIHGVESRIQDCLGFHYMGRYLETQNSCIKIAEEAANNINKYRPADIRTADDPRPHPTVAAGEACSVALVAILPVLILGAEVALLVSAEAWKLALTIRL